MTTAHVRTKYQAVTHGFLQKLHLLSTPTLRDYLSSAYKERDDALRVPLDRPPVRMSDPTYVLAVPEVLLSISNDYNLDDELRNDAADRYAHWEFAQSRINEIRLILQGRKEAAEAGHKLYRLDQRAHLRA